MANMCFAIKFIMKNNNLYYKFKFFTPGNPNISRFLIFFPTSSAMPQVNPAALEARFEVVSISLNDCIINVTNYKPTYRLKVSFHEVAVLLDTCLS